MNKRFKGMYIPCKHCKKRYWIAPKLDFKFYNTHDDMDYDGIEIENKLDEVIFVWKCPHCKEQEIVKFTFTKNGPVKVTKMYRRKNENKTT